MERVSTLLERFKEQVDGNAPIDELLITAQMIQSELNHLKSSAEGNSQQGVVAIDIPTGMEEKESGSEEKILMALQVDPDLVEAELEQIRKSAEAINNFSIKNKKPVQFDPIEDIPTLTHQKQQEPPKLESKNAKISEQAPIDESLNDKLKQSRKELSEALKETPIKDIKKAIGINDRFVFISELFSGDEAMFERSIKTINGFSIYPEAEYWIRRELKTKLGWDDKSDTVKQFDLLVRRRFS